jgi:hypothetical protein
VDKDFDWSVVTRLNERLPSAATGRFAAFFDGNATIVYLRPDQLTELGRLFGYDFISEVEPLEERPPSPSHFEAPLRSPLPVWALAICFVMGVFAASQLIAMFSRGTPYTIPGRDGSSAITLASAPLEFTFGVTAYTLGAALFLGVPLYLVIRWWTQKRTRSEY